MCIINMKLWGILNEWTLFDPTFRMGNKVSPVCFPPSDISLNHVYASHQIWIFFISLTYYHCLFFFCIMSFIIPFSKVVFYCMDIIQLFLSPLYSKTWCHQRCWVLLYMHVSALQSSLRLVLYTNMVEYFSPNFKTYTIVRYSKTNHCYYSN